MDWLGESSRSPRRACPVRRFLFGLALLALALVAVARPARCGMLVEAFCACGFQAGPMPVFAGRSNFKTSCLVPALCRATGRLAPVDVLNPSRWPTDCPSGGYLPYTDGALAPAEGTILSTWRLPDGRVVRLFVAGYECPRCHNKTLHLRQVGFFD